MISVNRQKPQNLTVNRQNTVSRQNRQNLTVNRQNRQNLTVNRQNRQNLTVRSQNRQNLTVNPQVPQAIWEIRPGDLWSLCNGKIIRICMRKKRFFLQFENTNGLSIKKSLPELLCLFTCLHCGFWSDWERFRWVLVPLLSLYISLERAMELKLNEIALNRSRNHSEDK